MHPRIVGLAKSTKYHLGDSARLAPEGQAAFRDKIVTVPGKRGDSRVQTMWFGLRRRNLHISLIISTSGRTALCRSNWRLAASS